ncbi:transcription elongation factor A protein 2-like isoform X16 [Oncorhynchus kisutch]|uniref:transcription elongation factor A protein 2-like isoform X16 n=1 Tax=Oncorhynchus kisutch TaxID=8019 RepID=UPI0009A03DD4|nr:transcription elongation factor A protein 2-like isoform X16 [Oncorhynchus kisutch]
MTREEELIRIAKKLDKMVSRNNTEGALDLLNELKSFNMTLKLLQETRIGMSVNGIRKHCTDDEVVSLAKILIKDWKRLLDAARTQSTERPNKMKNGVDSNKSTGSPVRSPLEKDTRKDLSDSKPKPAKRQSLDSSDSNPKRSKRQSLDSSDSNPKRSKRQSLDGKKDRKDSTDSKPSHSVKRHSTDSKSDRRDSVDSKTSNSPSAKKLSSETKEFHSSKSSHPGPLQRKSSTDSIERRGKPEMPKIPTTPTSPMSPSFSSAGVPLSLCLATGETIRDKCIEMLAAALRTDDNFKEFGTNCDSMAAEIEDHIYTEMGSTDMKYKNRVRSRISNLKDPKNPGLRRNVLAGGIELRRFAIMSAEEMASDELKQLRNNLTKEAIREHQLSKTSGTISDLFQCSKCGKKNCTYNQMQTRSADEPMTTFVLCNECGNRWKFC